MTAPKATRAKRTRDASAAPASAAVRNAGGVRFVAYLQAMASEIKAVRNSEKTKLRLMISALNLLEQVGFRELNLDEVVGDASLAKGTFYIHFPSKEDFLIELATRYLEFEQATIPLRPPAASPFAQLREWLGWYERTFELNVGIIRCIVQMAEVSSEMRSLWHRRNGTMVDRVLAGWYPARGGVTPELARLSLRLAGGMLDQSLFERYKVQLGPGREEPEDPALLSELHVLLAYRAIYGANPPEEELELTKPLLGWPG
ncbi:TetR/AcrR family transcriptional regulator [Erythrobacter sp. NE805]|uniref:TetR/AcrR family transcriptional regulator n=1 Tax=Erythrobacter sp. NE805 TaxID=3389875 RepID=UPI00396AF5AA